MLVFFLVLIRILFQMLKELVWISFEINFVYFFKNIQSKRF